MRHFWKARWVEFFARRVLIRRVFVFGCSIRSCVPSGHMSNRIDSVVSGKLICRWVQGLISRSATCIRGRVSPHQSTPCKRICLFCGPLVWLLRNWLGSWLWLWLGSWLWLWVDTLFGTSFDTLNVRLLLWRHHCIWKSNSIFF